MVYRRMEWQAERLTAAVGMGMFVCSDFLRGLDTLFEPRVNSQW